jgi:hypothetical protein
MIDDQFAKSRLYFEGLLPGNIYRLRNRSFAQIVGVMNNEEEARQIDPEQLIDVAKKMLIEWSELHNAEVDQTLMTALDHPRNLLEIASPDSVYVEPFPMMLQCKSCGVLNYHTRRERNEEKIRQAARRIRDRNGRPSVPCQRCSGAMRQVRYISVHRCGKMAPIDIPFSARGVTNLTYHDRGGTFVQSHFVDADTGHQLDNALQLPCRDCQHDYPDSQGHSKRGTPVDNPEKFYPHNIQYLCLRQETGRQVSRISGMIGPPGSPLTDSSRDIAEGVASCLLGIAKPDELAKHIQDTLGGKGPDSDIIDSLTAELETKRATLAEMIKLMSGVMSEDALSDATASQKKAISDIEEQLTFASGRFSSVRDVLDNDGILQNLAAHRRSLEAALIPYDFARERQTLPEMITQIVDPTLRDKMAQESSMLQSVYGVTEISHYKEINVVMASIGYTREKPYPGDEPEGHVVPTVLIGYEDLVNDRLKGKRMIYGLPARTEAIHIRLDPCKVLQWCVESAGWEDPGKSVTHDNVQARAYLFTNCPALTVDPAEVMAEMNQRPALEAAPFHLLHTISHCLLGTIKSHTGYDEKSVMEYMIPMDLSVILYVTSVQNYTAGGLLTLFRHYLKQWFDDASRYAFNCIFDPICSDKGSSCSGCVQVVLGCETFNHGLSRSYLHGGKIDDEQQIMITKGFW